MSQKSYTVLTVSVQLALPPGVTQQQMLERIKQAIETTHIATGSVVIKPLKRKVHYL